MNEENRCAYCNKSLSTKDWLRGTCDECNESLYAESSQPNETEEPDDCWTEADDCYEGLLDPTEKLWKRLR